MPPRKEQVKQDPSPRQRPATTPEDREMQMIEYADRLAEKQLRDGTATSQVITHYLKLGSGRERTEQRKLELESLRLEAQIKQAESAVNTEQFMEKVLSALKTYAGADDDDEE